MPIVTASRATLLIIDVQTRLVPAIDDGAAAVANARRLLRAAAIIGVPALFTEQNPKGLGPTLPELGADDARVVGKMAFDAGRAPGFDQRLGEAGDVIVAGVEAHVCVLQTALGLIGKGRRVFVVADAVGSRRPENKEAGLRRMERNGAEIVTTEMVIFEWLGDAGHSRFRDVVALIK